MEEKSPERLYSLLIKLRPLEHGTLMPFSGELVHAAWLDWIRNAAPDVSEMLHVSNQRRLFTCSSLRHPLPALRMREAEHYNTHLPLDPAKSYTIRLTLLLGELFPLFYSSLMQSSMQGKNRQQPFLRLGKQAFALEEVIASPEDPSGWTGYTSFKSLVERARATRLKATDVLELDFATLTTFHRGTISSTYGKHYVMVPLPQYVFLWLARRWQELAPVELASLVQFEQLERYIAEEGIVIDDHALHTHSVKFTRHPQRGFWGTCAYCLRRSEDEAQTPSPEQLPLRQQLFLLSLFAFYTGVGYKTPMGMGQVRLKQH